VSKSLAVVSLAVTLLAASPAAAQGDRGSGANVVQAFGRLCLTNNATPDAIAGNVAKEAGWSAIAFPANHKANKADATLAWSGPIDGRVFELIVTRNSRQARFGTTCLLRSAAKERFYPYFDDFRTVTKAAGLSGRETDVPHFFRASGKLADGRMAEAILNTRFPEGRENYTALQVTF
jgi:hypothetical protein